MRLKNQRFSSEELLLIRKLTDEGKSLNYLSQLMKVGKPTVCYQVRKFKPRIKKEFTVNLDDFQIGELIGAFAGDGSYSHRKYDNKFPQKSSHYKINYFLTLSKEVGYASYLRDLLVSLNLNPFFSYSSKGGISIGVNSKEYFEFIINFLIWDDNKTLTVRPRKDLQYTDQFLKGFARGLMDTDGFVEISNVSCACISQELIHNLTEIFDKYSLKYKLTRKEREGRHTLFLVRVYRESLEKYKELIGFSNLHKLNSLNKILIKEHRKG